MKFSPPEYLARELEENFASLIALSFDRQTIGKINANMKLAQTIGYVANIEIKMVEGKEKLQIKQYRKIKTMIKNVRNEKEQTALQHESDVLKLGREVSRLQKELEAKEKTGSPES